MADTKNPRRADPRTADAEEMVEVTLRRSVGRRGSPFYGPGRVKVPRSLYESIKLSPDLVATDAAGNPQPNTVAASVFGGATSTTTTRDAHPMPARDEKGKIVENGEPSAADRRSAEIAENAETGSERQGGKLAGETGSLDETRENLPLPGQTEESAQQREQREREEARAGSSATASGSTGKPLTKSELRSTDEAILLDLARRNRVKVPKRGGKKALVDALYNARVTLN